MEYLKTQPLIEYREEEIEKEVNSLVSYSKLKDELPKNTVSKIQAIFDKFDITPIQDWSHNESFSCSLRLRLNGIDVASSNGKGTNLKFALASSYGEAIERIESGILLNNFLGAKLYSSLTLKKDKSELKKDFLSYNNSFFKHHALKLFDRTFLNQKIPKFNTLDEILNFLEQNSTFQDDCLQVSKYYSVFEKKTVEIPDALLECYFSGTNGLSAGNTIEETLVQAFSEVFERYAQKTILLENINPPEIPPEMYLKYEEIKNIIESYLEKGVEVKIFDASLNKKLPVIMALFYQKETEKLMVGFGSHPNFAIAVERCLTEFSQGGFLGRFSFYPKDYLEHYCFSKGVYVYNAFLEVSVPYNKKRLQEAVSYEIDKDLWQKEEKTNKEALKDIIKLCFEQNYSVYINNCSFLGFPCFHVYIPEISHFVSDFKITTFINRILKEAKARGCEPIILILDYLKNNKELENIYEWSRNSIFMDAFGLRCTIFTPIQIALIAGYKLKRFDELITFLDAVYAKGLNQYDDIMDLIQPIRYLVESKEYEKLDRFILNLFNNCYLKNQEEIEVNKDPVKYGCITKGEFENIQKERKNLKESFIKIAKLKRDYEPDYTELEELLKSIFEGVMYPK